MEINHVLSCHGCLIDQGIFLPVAHGVLVSLPWQDLRDNPARPMLLLPLHKGLNLFKLKEVVLGRAS